MVLHCCRTQCQDNLQVKLGEIGYVSLIVFMCGVMFLCNIDVMETLLRKLVKLTVTISVSLNTLNLYCRHIKHFSYIAKKVMYTFYYVRITIFLFNFFIQQPIYY